MLINYSDLRTKNYDYCIVGAGIIGISTAYQLMKKHPKAKIILIEKEKQAAIHQTGRNAF